MMQSRWPFIGGIVALGAAGGLLGGINHYWVNHGPFPAYGLIIDLLALPVLLAGILYVRRFGKRSSDEFSVAKKRYATQYGMIIGLILFAITGVWPIVLPGLYHSFIASLDGADDGFIMGRVFGMAPFIIGLLVGQVLAWKRYS